MSARQHDRAAETEYDADADEREHLAEQHALSAPCCAPSAMRMPISRVRCVST